MDTVRKKRTQTSSITYADVLPGDMLFDGINPGLGLVVSKTKISRRTLFIVIIWSDIGLDWLELSPCAKPDDCGFTVLARP